MNKPGWYIRLRNFLHPGYSACSLCGGNWGWKKHRGHFTNDSTGLFLFCVECDKVVTVEERWEALNEWKLDSIDSLGSLGLPEKQFQEELEKIRNTEFIEFPRSKPNG